MSFVKYIYPPPPALYLGKCSCINILLILNNLHKYWQNRCENFVYTFVNVNSTLKKKYLYNRNKLEIFKILNCKLYTNIARNKIKMLK